MAGWHWYACVHQSERGRAICCLISSTNLHKDRPLIRSKQQAAAYKRHRASVCLRVRVCVWVGACVHWRTGEVGVFSLLLTQDNRTAKGWSKRALSELMKRKPFTLLHKDIRLSPCRGLCLCFSTQPNHVFVLPCQLCIRLSPQSPANLARKKIEKLK